MARQFEIPEFYRSLVASSVKRTLRELPAARSGLDPFELDLGRVKFRLARHFGFCFGVENAIEIAYRAVRENPDRRIFLLSEMIHNPRVNADLAERGVRFLRSTRGEQLVPFSDLAPEDIVIIPAFGTTLELFQVLEKIGVKTKRYNATCPFVEKVWRRSAQLGGRGFTIVIHGKHSHEETQATFSHASKFGPSLVVADPREASILAEFITQARPIAEFEECFSGRYSGSFSPELHLARIGVVNQTTMLAPETLGISALLREALRVRYGEDKLAEHFADTKDTLCYATNENQEAVSALIDSGGDLAIVVGGYNSSNTSHLVELCENRLPTFYIQDAGEILGREEIRHLDLATRTLKTTSKWLPLMKERPLEILLTAGASCPDSLVDEVIKKIAGLFGAAELVDNQCRTALNNRTSKLRRYGTDTN